MRWVLMADNRRVTVSKAIKNSLETLENENHGYDKYLNSIEGNMKDPSPGTPTPGLKP